MEVTKKALVCIFHHTGDIRVIELRRTTALLASLNDMRSCQPIQFHEELGAKERLQANQGSSQESAGCCTKGARAETPATSSKLVLENKLYQEEFAENVKSRIDEDIRKRKDNLIEIKSERDRRDKEFLQEMNIKRELEDCYEIREALTRRDMLQVKEAQLEQITEINASSYGNARR
ncbi:unnamed protein product [Ceratitis capitata]|uniref:(Mediterranean fruit fly) hypothetical protein n=1 Tax=Ceratitis capitata TaxID=7213 RepID=A0A811U5I9_CERCA|nr:unnamed protein product [Ceratitis capitata]